MLMYELALMLRYPISLKNIILIVSSLGLRLARPEDSVKMLMYARKKIHLT